MASGKKGHVPDTWEAIDRDLNLGDTLGSGTGETENTMQSGGWAGTDDATSTAPSDMPPVSQDDELEGLHVFQSPATPDEDA